MCHPRLPSILLFGCIGCMATGCSQPGNQSRPIAHEKNAAAASNRPGPQPLAVSRPIEKTDPSVDIELPYPEREDLFLPPKLVDSRRAATSPDDLTLQLKGFANSDQTRALLMINGRLTPLKAGDAHGEIEVLSIVPPQVTLRRGGRTWIESLAPLSHRPSPVSPPE